MGRPRKDGTPARKPATKPEESSATPATDTEPGRDVMATPGPGETPSTAKMYADNPRESTTREPGVVSVAQLSGDDEVAARTGPDAPSDGKFRHVFTLSRVHYAEGKDNDDMHRANEVATLQLALNRGVHPKGEAYLEATSTRLDGSVDLTYAVEAIPAVEDEVPGESQVPAKAIRDFGGSTIKAAQNDVVYGTDRKAAKDDGGVSV